MYHLDLIRNLFTLPGNKIWRSQTSIKTNKSAINIISLVLSPQIYIIKDQLKKFGPEAGFPSANGFVISPRYFSCGT